MLLPTLLLASNSPRRHHLLAVGGFQFRVQSVSIDERPYPLESPADYVLRLAESKALAARGLARSGELILAADTTVADGGDILGKPAGPDEAVEMLLRLCGRWHAVHTAIALYRPQDGFLTTDLCTTSVPMRAYSLPEVVEYVASGDPLDKAGAYAIQHPTFHPVETLTGCFASVMGLPLCHLARTVSALSLQLPEGIPQACQSDLHYRCPIFERVLLGEKIG